MSRQILSSRRILKNGRQPRLFAAAWAKSPAGGHIPGISAAALLWEW